MLYRDVSVGTIKQILKCEEIEKKICEKHVIFLNILD